MNNNLIYLDNNATTPIDPEVLEAMMPFLKESFANASSTHEFGLVASDAVKNARASVAKLIGAESHEIVFTSGATEAINIALKGIVQTNISKGKQIITVTTEHSAVLDTCSFLEKQGCQVTYLNVGKDGLIDLDELQNAITQDTILISVMYANNETGIIQPISEIADITHKAGAIFFCDATQAVGKVEIDVDSLGIDMLSMSGHKIYAPKGVGALFIRSRKPNKVKVEALMHGGGHERGVRSGTLNVPGIVALGKACELAAKRMNDDIEKITVLRDYLESKLLKIKHVTVNGDVTKRMYNITNLCFHGVDSDAIIIGLSNPEEDIKSIAVSNGSACTSSKIEPSHVLLAIGLSENDAYSSIRFSLGRFNTKAEIDTVIQQVNQTINSLKAMTGQL